MDQSTILCTSRKMDRDEGYSIWLTRGSHGEDKHSDGFYTRIPESYIHCSWAALGHLIAQFVVASVNAVVAIPKRAFVVS
jgi:hypothetical protein